MKAPPSAGLKGGNSGSCLNFKEENYLRYNEELEKTKIKGIRYSMHLSHWIVSYSIWKKAMNIVDG